MNSDKFQYKHSDFSELLKDEINTKCFDCGNEPVAWASLNNSIYLCLLCSGVHRSFGVSISSIRSLTMDEWNHNQIAFMKIGGNKRLLDLINKYEISRETLPHILYNSKLLAYHRKLIKNEIIKTEDIIIPPLPEEALLSINDKTNNLNKEYDEKTDQNDGYFTQFSGFMSKAYEKTISIAENVKDKVVESDITKKLKEASDKTVDVLKETTTKVVNKGADLISDGKNLVMTKGVDMINDGKNLVITKSAEVAQSSTVQTVKSKATEGYNYIYGKLFGKKEENQNEQQN